MMGEMKKAEKIKEWWGKNLADRNSGRARGFSARLRRASRIDLLLEPQVHELAQELGMNKYADDIYRVGLLIAALADVRENDSRTLAQRLGGADPVMSRLRFNKLARADGDEFLQGLRRAMPLVNRRCNVAQLASDLLVWDHPEYGDRTRARWCFEYFSTSKPAETENAKLDQFQTSESK